MLAAFERRFVWRVQAVDTGTKTAIIVTMTTTPETEFEVRPGRMRAERAPTLRAIRARVRAAAHKSSSGARPRLARTGYRAHFAKGSSTRQPASDTMSRRVVVKMRYVQHGASTGAPLRSHVAYLAREASQRHMTAAVETGEERGSGLSKTVDYLGREDVARDAKAPFYDRMATGVDGAAITSGWRGDARHFRMIVSAEDGEAMGDLKPFIRELMVNLETKLGTRLDWIAADHHDTDNPHSHVLIRGRRADGQDLFIPSRMVSQGIRSEAQAIATRILGPRQAIDLIQERARDIDLKGLSPLDHDLIAQAGRGALRPGRVDLVARLERLEGWGLAQRDPVGWALHPDLKRELLQLADRAEVERHILLLRRGDHSPLLAADADSPVWGRLVHAGPGDDFGESFLAVIETGRGELRYARFERSDDLAVLADAQRDAIVAFNPATAVAKPSDDAIARVSRLAGGVYSAAIHAELEPNVPRGLIEANIRRLEAMRRAGLVTRRPDGVFETGHDQVDRGISFEQRRIRRFPISVRAQSYWTLAEQVTAIGPTHLDRVLSRQSPAPDGEGAFARQFARAMQQRRLFLIEEGWLGKDDPSLDPAVLVKLASRELRDLARRLSKELSVPVSTQSHGQVIGAYARRIDLAQGRFALILGPDSAVIAAWRPPLERFAGRQVEGAMRGMTVSWRLQRGLGVGLPPM
jgi:hypothetical protein